MGEEKRGGGVGMLHPTLENPEGQKARRVIERATQSTGGF
jgi:hypothetical protein